MSLLLRWCDNVEDACAFSKAGSGTVQLKLLQEPTAIRGLHHHHFAFTLARD